MTAKQLIEIVSKSFGLYFIVQLFLDGKQIISYLILISVGENTGFGFVGIYLWSFFAYAVAAWFMIVKSGRVANLLYKKDDEALLFKISNTDLIAAVIVAIGLLTIVNAVPEILNKVSHYVYFNEFDREEKGRFWTLNNRKADILYSVFKLAVGLVTLTNAKILSKYLTKGERIDEKRV
jgi:hypothetical protein